MTRSIIVIRHAATQKGSPDIVRPISDEGVNQAKSCALQLQKDGVIFDLAITSSATRAKNTLEVILTELKQNPPTIEVDSIYQPINPDDKIAVDTMLNSMGHDPIGTYLENHPSDSWSRYEKRAIIDVLAILEKYQPQRVLIVGHMNIINSIGLGLAPKAVELNNIYFRNCEGYEIKDGKIVRLIKK